MREKKFILNYFIFLKLCKNKVGNDSYAERGVNTFNDLPKAKCTQTEKLLINVRNKFKFELFFNQLILRKEEFCVQLGICMMHLIRMKAKIH